MTLTSIRFILDVLGEKLSSGLIDFVSKVSCGFVLICSTKLSAFFKMGIKGFQLFAVYWN